MINKIKLTKENGSKIIETELENKHTKTAILIPDNSRTTFDMVTEKYNFKS